MDPFQSFLSSLSPSRSKSPTPAKSRFRRHPPPELSLHSPPKLSSSVSSSNLLAPHTPNAIAANPNASTSNLRASSPSPDRDKKGKRRMLAQPLAFHLPRARSPKPPRPMPSIPQDEPEVEIPLSPSTSSLAAPSVPARSPLRGTPRSVGSFSSLLNSYTQPNGSHSDSTLALAPMDEEPQGSTGWTQLLPSAAPPSPSIYSPIQSIFPEERRTSEERRVRRSASLRADKLNTVGKGPRLEALKMPSTRVRSASVSSPMLYEDGADLDANKGPNSRPDVIPRRSVDAYREPTRTMSPRPSVSRVSRDTRPINLAPIRDSAITIPGEKDLPPPPPPKLHVRMQSEFTLGPEFALIGTDSRGITTVQGLPTVEAGLSPTASAESGESSSFETAASQTNNTSLDTSIPIRPSRPGTSLSLTHPTRPGTSASMNRPNPGMVITLPLPSSTPTHAPTPSSATPSTRTSTSQVSLLVDSPERAYGYKPNANGTLPPSQSSLTVDVPVPDAPIPSPSTSTAPKTSKRVHALLELLSSERAYASDLALIRDIYLPLAKGLPTVYPLPPSVGSLMFPGTPAPATSPTSRILRKGTTDGKKPNGTDGKKSLDGKKAKKSSNSNSTAPGNIPPTTPTSPNDAPMTAQDVKIIFGNIEELAAFADELSDKLEVALGSVVPGGTGEDHVGELFCELAPRMAPMYLTYITKHPTAVARYTSLSTNPTPAMMQYLATTRAMTSSITHAWDIPSLIIKPLQRLLKYPLILQTILENTPVTMGHKDRATLYLAKDKLEEVARQVNEGRRRWEVVKGVLESGKSPPSSAKGRIKTFKGRTSTNGAEASQADLVKLEKRVKEGAAAANSMAEQVQNWANELTSGAVRLLGWSRSFARVVDLDVLLGGDPQGGSEAVRAFTTVAQSLEDLSRELAAVIKEELVPQLARLSKTTREPLLLLAHMHTLGSAHHNLVNAPYSKSRPAALLEASQAYLALAAQLREELPRYVDMFERAFGIVVLRLSGWQARYFQEAERRWKEFWLALNVEESEVGAGESAAIETVRIWWSRWEATARQTAGMSIVTPNKRVYGGGANGGASSSRHQQQQQQPPQPGTPSSDGASWDYVPPYHSKPSALSLGDQQSAASATSSKGHSRAVSTDLASPVPRTRSGASLGPRVQSDPAPERLLPKGKKSQRGSSNLRKVTDTLFGGTPGDLTGSNTPARNSAHSSSSRMQQQSVLYAAAAIHPFNPETDATHLGLPFLSLQIGDTLEILVEAGHPSEHSNLPIPYDDAPDCMLAARNEDGVEGWALASYLLPLT